MCMSSKSSEPSKSPKKPSGKKTSAKKPSAGKPSRKSGGYSFKVLMIALVLLGGLAISLVLLSQMRKEPEDARPAPSAKERREVPEKGRKAERRQELPEAEEDHPAPEVTRPETPPESPTTEQARPEPRVLPPSPGPRADGAPIRLAIIMDDLGRDMATGRALVDMGIPITFAILPDQPQSSRLAEYAHENGREVIIHLPMEPQGYPVTNPGKEALFVDLQSEEVAKRMRSFIARVPHAVGGNNHMGSRFTENRQGMQSALAVLKESNLFFVDSYTSPRSVGFDEARNAGIPFAVRDVFLDNVQEVGAISAQIEKLIRVAEKKGQAVGICHPHPQTLAALRLAVPEFKRLGIEVVPVSTLLQR